MRSVRTRAGKTLVPLLGVLTVLAVGVAAFAIVVQMQERDKRLAKEKELMLALAENEDLKAKLDDIQQSKSSIEEELARIRKDLAQAQQELAKAVEAQETLTRSVEDREREITRLNTDLEQTSSQKKQAADQLTQLQTERDAIKQQLADLEQAKNELEAKVMELSDRPTVELDKVVVSGEPSGSLASASPDSRALPVSTTTASSATGQVVVVNREYDFIVMNMGKNQGLTVGQEFKIVRGSEVLGKVKVERVYDELSAAAILPESKKDSIREGDAVAAL